MTDSNPFFKLIWRINALIVLAVGILGIGVLIFASYQILKEVFNTRNVSNIVNVESDQTEIEQNWWVGYSSEIKGTPYLLLPLRLNQNYQQSFYDKESYSTRNYLFLNGDNTEQTWLLNTNQYLITRHIELTEPNDKEEKLTIALLYQIIKADTDGNKRLNPDDAITIGLSKPNGLNYQEFLDNVDALLGQHVIDKNTLLVLYRQNGKVFSSHIDLNNFTIRNTVQLPMPQDKSL